jgi:hypothetical protein
MEIQISPRRRFSAVKKIVIGLCIVVCLGVSWQEVRALGVGVILGEPTGISFKQWMTKGNAVGGAVAWSFREESALHAHVDYLYHRPGMPAADSDVGRLLLYFGIGARFKAQENDSRLGARIPLGVDYVFASSPLDIFLEIAPLLDLAPETEFRLNGGFGIRYYF